MNGGQIRADFGVIDQLGADQRSHMGNVEGTKAQLMSAVSGALGALDGGMGTEEHQACMRKAEGIIDDYIGSQQTMNRSTNQVGETFLGAGMRTRGILGQGG